MSNELTITSIYTDIGNTYDGLINNLKQTTLMQNQSNLLQCVVCYRLREHIEANTKKGSAERKEQLLRVVKVLGANAKLSLFTKYAVVGNKVQSVIDNGVAPELALSKSMENYRTVQVKKQSNPKPKKPVDVKIQELQTKLDDTLEELDAYKVWKKKILNAIRQQDLDYIRQLMKE